MARMIPATISPDNESKTEEHSYYPFRNAKGNWNVAAVDPNGLQVSSEFNFQLLHLNNRGSVPQFLRAQSRGAFVPFISYHDSADR